MKKKIKSLLTYGKHVTLTKSKKNEMIARKQHTYSHNLSKVYLYPLYSIKWGDIQKIRINCCHTNLAIRDHAARVGRTDTGCAFLRMWRE